MGQRDRKISTSILRAIFPKQTPSENPSFLKRVVAFFSIFQLPLTRYRINVFKKLRNDIWEIDESEYTESFRSQSNNKRTDLVAIGDLGYSGSTFFTTPNSTYLVKSLPRHFEQSFFRTRLLDPYTEHMSQTPTSLLVRITDLVCSSTPTLGSLFGISPSHHIIMENVLFGKSSCTKEDQKKWENYDLKPIDYFYPERDIAGGKLAPESVKERLVDKFPDKVRVTVDEKEDLVATLSKDTKVLQDANAVDYSLFLVRYPYSLTNNSSIPPVPGTSSPWRSGIVSRDKKWVYRVVLLDFFWAKDALQAKTLTGLVNAWNFLGLGRQQPMSITTTSDEYRSRFLKMIDAIVEVPDSAGRPSGEIRVTSPEAGNA